MIWRMPIVAVAAGLACTLAMAPVAECDETGRVNPFDGEWTLTFTVSTPPGGITLSGHMTTYHPYNLQFRADKRFTVAQDGKIALHAADAGALHIDGRGQAAGQTWTYQEDHASLVKIAGMATATPNGPGAREPYARQVELTIEWGGGNGTYFHQSSAGAFTGTYSVADDGTQFTVTGPGVAYVQPVKYWTSSWKLTPVQTIVEELDPDVLQERVMYEGRREAAIETSMGSAKVNERIEMKQVRNLNVIPRDGRR